jgi:UDP-N-acetylmuramoylalanine--D-glutamate ligase
VGTTVIEAVESPEKYEFLVLELSSFQLHWLEDAHFVSVAILNIAEDHVDWHGSLDAYAADKFSLLEKSNTAILNADDGRVVTNTVHWQGRKVFFSLDTPAPGEIGIVEELLVDRAFVADAQEAAMFCELAEVTPTVPHNVSNALAASALARTAGIDHEQIREAIKTFRPGRHRIETVLEKDGITWINDSKATNPHAAAASIMSALSVIWVAGGLAKGAAMGELIERVKSRVRVAILIGADRRKRWQVIVYIGKKFFKIKTVKLIHLNRHCAVVRCCEQCASAKDSILKTDGLSSEYDIVAQVSKC